LNAFKFLMIVFKFGFAPFVPPSKIQAIIARKMRMVQIVMCRRCFEFKQPVCAKAIGVNLVAQMSNYIQQHL
jgi:hypothetical protein